MTEEAKAPTDLAALADEMRSVSGAFAEPALIAEWEQRIRALAAQPAPDTVSVQQAWEWAGGNPGIKATREDLQAALHDLDAVCDDADAQPAPVLHSDDAAVDAFANAMKEKLATARAKGRGGWDDTSDPDLHQHLSNLLREHVEKGDPRDVANFCMFLHQRGESILPTHDIDEAQPAPVVGEPLHVECRQCDNCNHSGINDLHSTDAACFDCDWSGPSPIEDKCPGCGNTNCMTAACPKCGAKYALIADAELLSVRPAVAEVEILVLDPSGFELAIERGDDGKWRCPYAAHHYNELDARPAVEGGHSLPELPTVKHGLPYTATDYYTADQMRAYAQAAVEGAQGARGGEKVGYQQIFNAIAAAKPGTQNGISVKAFLAELGVDAIYATPPPATGSGGDCERLDYIIQNDAFFMRKVADSGATTYQLVTQDEDESYINLSGGEHRFFGTPREAIDAAMEAHPAPASGS